MIDAFEFLYNVGLGMCHTFKITYGNTFYSIGIDH